MFFEEDLSGEAKPFAGNAVLMIRFDLNPGTPLDKVREKDLQVLRKQGTPFELIGNGKTELGGMTFEHVEWASEDERLGVLRHLALYISKEQHVYTATATHLADRFDGIRAQFIEFVRSFVQGSKE